MAAERNIKIYQGDTYVHEVQIRNNSNVALDITGRTYSGQMRKSKTSDTVVATFTTNISNAVGGVFQFSLSSSITSNIQSGVYYYDIQETNQTTITTLISGRAEVQGEVTRVG